MNKTNKKSLPSWGLDSSDTRKIKINIDNGKCEEER